MMNIKAYTEDVKLLEHLPIDYKSVECKVVVAELWKMVFQTNWEDRYFDQFKSGELKINPADYREENSHFIFGAYLQDTDRSIAAELLETIFNESPLWLPNEMIHFIVA